MRTLEKSITESAPYLWCLQLSNSILDYIHGFVEKDLVSRHEHQYTAKYKEICITLNY